MLAAFAEAARALDRGDGSRALVASYRQVAECNAEFLLRELRQGNGRLLRTWKACPEGTEGTGEAKLNGYLEDYSYLIEGLLVLYQTTFEPRWFVTARELAETMIKHFLAEGVQLRPEPQLPSKAAGLAKRRAQRTRNPLLSRCYRIAACWMGVLRLMCAAISRVRRRLPSRRDCGRTLGRGPRDLGTEGNAQRQRLPPNGSI
jgi:uncharacterized protein YyaL (SSP411 family)